MPEMWLKAHPIAPTAGWTLEPASSKREWMDATYKKVAYHCLPLVMANQSGWVVGCPANFTATWNGKLDNNAVKIDFAPDSLQYRHIAASHFGSGIITFHIPWLFRTPPGIGLFARGLTNYYKDNIHPLDGLIETSWAPYSFTMNWKVIRRNVTVYFKQGDPICLLQPYPLELLEQFNCAVEPFASAPADIQKGHIDFADKRNSALQHAPTGEYVPQRDYYTGRYPDGCPAHYPTGCPIPHGEPPEPKHRTKLDLKPFEAQPPPPPPIA